MSGTSKTAARLQPAAVVRGGQLLQRKCACGASKSPVGDLCERCYSRVLQRKLAVGTTHDPLEREADRIAEKVLAGPPTAVVYNTSPSIQRFAQCQTEVAAAAPDSVGRAIAVPGVPLSPVFRREMETRFGHDFSRVRIHTDAVAVQSARDVNARAYTVGRDVVFGANGFAPHTDSGRRLLAHELTHVIQQAGARRMVQRQPDPGQKPDEQPPLFTVFVADRRRRTDRRFARKEAEEDVARLDAGAMLSVEDRQLVNAKLRFFEGDAKEIYTLLIRPALVRATRKPIEMPPMYLGKVPDAEPAEQDRIRKRRERTYRWFMKYQDYQLKDAYISRLQRYLDEGMEANNYWDVEMIEQIIAERVSNAPWHAAAQQDFLAKRAAKQRSQARENSLSTLPPYWQNQFGALAEQTANWPDGARTYARDLLWKWREQVAPYDNLPYVRDVLQPPVAEDLIFKDIMARFEVDLHDRDRAIQKECKEHPPGRMMKIYGDPCKSWFAENSLRAEDERRNLSMRMRIMRDKERLPYRDIIYLLQEYTKAVGGLPTRMGEVELQILQTWATVQGALTMVARPMEPLPALAASTVGEIRSPPGMGPHVVVAVKDEVEVLKPLTAAPPPGRALGPGVPASAPPAATPGLVVSEAKPPVPVTSTPGTLALPGEVTQVPPVAPKPPALPLPVVVKQLPHPASPSAPTSPAKPGADQAAADAAAARKKADDKFAEIERSRKKRQQLQGSKPEEKRETKSKPAVPGQPVKRPRRRNATLTIQKYNGQKFKSRYAAPPQFRDSERTVGLALEASSPGWTPKPVKLRAGGRLMSTIPEFFKPDVGGVPVAVEVKDLALADLRPNFAGWAEQLARRIDTIAGHPRRPLQNWLFVDLRGASVEIDPPSLAARIRDGLAAEGRIGNEPGPTFDKIFFILDDFIVEMP